jgi:tryptophan synthase alpha chain
MKRIAEKFKQLKEQQKPALITYICAGDPDFETSLQTLKALPESGCDIIELGIPFLDPSGDGPTIQKASKRAIENGMTLQKTLEMVANFRKSDAKTPLILMGYYNPILKFGIDKIFLEAEKSGVDGFLIVDLPPEEEEEILAEISQTNLDLIRLVAPTTNNERMKKITKNAGGFLYLISMLGITGTALAKAEDSKEAVEKLRQISNLPIAVGFGIQDPAQAAEFSKIGADAIVIGSVIVKEMAEKKSSDEIIKSVSNKIREFSQKIKL